MAINVPGLPLSTKTPGTYLSLVFGGPGTSAGIAPSKILLLGNQITTTITVTGTRGSVSYTAGTGTVGTAVQVFSASDAKARFGAGSELHLMASAAFDADPNATVWAMPTAEGSVRGSAGVTPTGTATAAGSIRVFVCGRYFDVAVASGDTALVVGTAIGQGINDQADWPVTAAVNGSTGAVTISSRNFGTRANLISFRCTMTSSTSTAEARSLGGVLQAATLFGTTLTLSNGTARGGNYFLTSGAGTDVLTATLPNVASQRFHRYALAQVDSTNLGYAVSQMDTMAGPTVQLLQQCVAASTDTYANTATIAAAQNALRLQLAWCYNAETLPCEIAARVAAARLIGDGRLAGSITGEGTDCACNLDGLQLNLAPADQVADRPLPTQVESALNYGITPLVPSVNASRSTLVRSITTRFKDAFGAANFAVLDTSNVTIVDFVADDLRADCSTTFAGCKLADDAADGTQPKIAGVVTPSIVKARLHSRLKLHEEAARITDVDARASSLVVERNRTVVGRLDADIPVVPIPGLHVVGGVVRQLSP